MQIYEQEIMDGIGDLIKSTASIKIDSKLQPGKGDEKQISIAKAAYSKAFSNPGQIDLYYMDAILASTGWNKNDDVFDKVETWNARATPVDKPFNYMHDGNDIIGHITGSAIIDAQGNFIPYDSDLPDVPDNYDVVTSSVIYKIWPDEARRDQIEELIQEIEDGKWFVSMECLFPSFDYAVIDEDGQQKIIARTADTAFLSKHLKAYGGTGDYKGYKVGRLIRNFTFSGKGLVDKPANPRSVIFNESLIFDGAEASVQIFTETKGIEQMAENINVELQSKISALEVQLAKANEMNATLKSKADEEAKQSYETKISELEAQIAQIKSDLAEKEKTVAELQLTVSESSKAMTEKETELNTIKAEMVKTARANKLTEAGVSKEELETVIAQFADANDVMFDAVVTLYAAKKAASEKADKMGTTKCEETEAEKEEKEVKAEAAKTPENVEVVETPKEPDLATAGDVSENAKNVREIATAALKGSIFRTTRAVAKASK